MPEVVVVVSGRDAGRDLLKFLERLGDTLALWRSAWFVHSRQRFCWEGRSGAEGLAENCVGIHDVLVGAQCGWSARLCCCRKNDRWKVRSWSM